MADVVGPGAIKEQGVSPDPILQGASEYEFVTILNPLIDDFQVMVAQDVPVNLPFELRSPTSSVQSEGDVVRNYGVPLKNPDHKGKKYIYNTTIIPAGESRNFKGDVAQVVVRQLVNEILQREGNKRLMADPTLRREVESRIIVKRGSVQDIIDRDITTPRQAIDEAVNQSNEAKNEESFPGLNKGGQAQVANPPAGTGASYTPASDSGGKEAVGRPKATNS